MPNTELSPTFFPSLHSSPIVTKFTLLPLWKHLSSAPPLPSLPYHRASSLPPRLCLPAGSLAPLQPFLCYRAKTNLLKSTCDGIALVHTPFLTRSLPTTVPASALPLPCRDPAPHSLAILCSALPLSPGEAHAFPPPDSRLNPWPSWSRAQTFITASVTPHHYYSTSLSVSPQILCTS